MKGIIVLAMVCVFFVSVAQAQVVAPTQEYIKIDKDNYEVKSVVKKVNVTALKDKKEALLRIKDMKDSEILMIFDLVQRSHMMVPSQTFQEVIDAQIKQIDDDLAKCK